MATCHDYSVVRNDSLKLAIFFKTRRALGARTSDYIISTCDVVLKIEASEEPEVRKTQEDHNDQNNRYVASAQEIIKCSGGIDECNKTCEKKFNKKK
jgi:hypothetical protein